MANVPKDSMDGLKPCPFCGAVPVAWCDITDWLGIPVFKANENGFRPYKYVIQAVHKKGCFIRTMDGLNLEGRMTSGSWPNIVASWNGRWKGDADDPGTH